MTRLVRLLLTAALLASWVAGARAQTAYAFTTLAGQSTPPGYVDGPGNAARFNAPLGVAVDGAGNIYVADTGNAVIRRITPAGVVSTFAGTRGGFATIDGPPGVGQIASPAQLTFDRDGNLLVVQTSYSGYVRKLTPAGTITTVAGSGSQLLDGPVSFAGFSEPRGLAVDGAGDIFVADTGNGEIREIFPAGFVTTIAGAYAGAGAVDSVDGPGLVARFNRPSAAALDAAGNLYIADAGNNTIRMITPAGIVSTFAGVPRTSGAADGARTTATFSAPAGLVFDAAGNLYVADSGNQTIRKISNSGVVSTVAGLAQVYGGDDGTGPLARFQDPTGLALDGAGNLIVADTANNTIRRVTPAGVVTTIAGRALLGSSDGSADSARFLWLTNLAIDAAGNVYAADTGSHTVRKITPAGNVSTLAGQAGFVGAVDGLGAAARFNTPNGLAIDGAGNLYVADTNNDLIRKVSPSGSVTTLAGQPGSQGSEDGMGSGARFRRPQGVAVDAAGNVFVADTYNQRIRKITPAGVVTTFAGSGAYGNADGIATAATFLAPSSLAIDRSGVLFVLDGGWSLRKITPDGTVTTYAGATNNVGDGDGPVSAAQFSGIGGIALDASGNLFLTDGTTVREITAQGNVATLGGRVGMSGFTDGVGGFARFQSPMGIAVDAAGNLYIADAGNFVVRKGAPTTAIAPPIITNLDPQSQNAQSRKAVAGDTVTFQVAAAGSGPLAYQWFKNNVAIPGATTATLTLANVSPADEGSYAVTVGNAAGLETFVAGSMSVYTPTLSSFTTRHVVNGGAFLWSIAHGNGRLVTVGTGGTILTSTDGRTWTRQNSGTTDWLVGVTFGGNQFVAVGDLGDILTSPDAVTWTKAASSGTTQRLNNVIYGAGKFVAVGEAGTIVTSTDAQHWTPRASGVTTWLRGLAYNAAQDYFALSGQSGVFRTSADAITWSADPPAIVNGDLEATVAVDSYSTFVSVGQDGLATSATRYFFSEWYDPTYRAYSWGWSGNSAGTNVRLRGLAEGANAIFATGENGVILTAPDISGPWAHLASGTSANLVGGDFSGNTLYVVGDNETILQSDPLYTSRLINISTRGKVTPANAMISGFVVTGTAPKQVLLRAAGPGLANFAVAGPLAAPSLTLFDGARHPLGANSGWGSGPDAAAVAAAAVRVGAFPFATGSGDAALLATLPPGAYTAQVTSSSASGIALVEAYDADPSGNEGSRAINISTLGFAGTGVEQLVAGFVINGTAARRLLIRAVGPSLAQFGVSGTLAQPQLQLYNSHGTSQTTAGAWSTQVNAGEIRSAAISAGAFALLESSTDAALVTTLAPGAWTVQVSGLSSTTGTVLLEVYDLP